MLSLSILIKIQLQVRTYIYITINILTVDKQNNELKSHFFVFIMLLHLRARLHNVHFLHLQSAGEYNMFFSLSWIYIVHFDHFPPPREIFLSL